MKMLLKAIILFSITTHIYGIEKDYKCNFSWNTLSKKKSFPSKNLNKVQTIEIDSQTTASISKEKDATHLEIKEYFKENRKNYVSYTFSCDDTVNCNGSYLQKIEGKSEQENLVITPGPQSAMGSIKERELFNFQKHPKGFKYSFILYRAKSNLPMGLTLDCKK